MGQAQRIESGAWDIATIPALHAARRAALRPTFIQALSLRRGRPGVRPL